MFSFAQAQNKAPATPGNLSVNDLSGQRQGQSNTGNGSGFSFSAAPPQQQQQQSSGGPFGQNQSQHTQGAGATSGFSFGSQQQPSQSSNNLFGGQTSGQTQAQSQPQSQWGQIQFNQSAPQTTSLFGSSGANASSQNLFGGAAAGQGTNAQAFQQGAQAHSMNSGRSPPQREVEARYMPGYLAKLKGQKPFNAHAREPSSEPNYLTGTPARNSTAGIAGDSADSPSVQFSSSFFRSVPGDASTDHAHGRFGSSISPDRYGQGGAVREGDLEPSIFGPGGLRGNKRVPSSSFNASNKSLKGSLRRSRSGAFGRSVNDFTSSVGPASSELDDPPPNEYLADETALYARGGAFGEDAASEIREVAGSSLKNQATHRSALSLPPSKTNDASNDASLRTILIYGFNPAQRNAVAEHYKSFGEVVDISLEENSGAIRLEYAEAWVATRALRRNGEAVPSASGGGYVGVRLASEELHRQVVLYGLEVVGTSTGASLSGPPSSSTSAAASHSQAAGSAQQASAGLTGTGTGAGGSSRGATPAFGRPISIIGEPGSAFAKKPASSAPSANHSAGAGQAGSVSNTSSPFRFATASLFGGASNPNSTVSRSSAQDFAGRPNQPSAQSAPTHNQNGVMSKLGDAIFGW
ncbi:hypothetical protein IE81DRAFT_347296 [Ceraceosorus guamensis]|uniref:RRM Nup35-type domain-containing protein n=1 Tax=Ceraceosorus guamensis TaxID=1522189 RepID=A0A316VYH8_9BASI|nr:hypothetical protein IE81DRAFT_347296 [Ceraceosorus guamensis]PWN42550.1 hypothetical protein IE81DRAFT_347296 [Ceraceosorus guamensis]